ncbi:MAG: DUF4340 domain-containing protein [Bacteroidales bacterium]|nr:DUF4340 domain-containing protein [Bacteroidales bacterium]MCF8456547.1 DUF4340 domain-containing protein [Bacteroidales bacterium]
MKNNKIYFIILIILVIAAAWLYMSRKNSTIKKELRDFSIQDTSLISKVFMVNKLNKTLLLERDESNGWIVNKKYKVRKDAIDLILKTFKRMEVKSPVSKAAFANAVKDLAATHVKVEVYTDDETEPLKTIYIGGPTQDMYGTYMMLENSNTPFIVHIPGFSGYLSSRFFLTENDWRDRSLFKYAYDQIRTVSLQDFRLPDQSFIANNLGDNQYSLIRFEDQKEIEDFDTVMVKQYLGYYKKISYERILDGISESKRDSILRSEPIYRISLTDDKSVETSITAYLKPGSGVIDREGGVYPYDLERMYAQINNDSNLVIIQYHVFDPLFMKLDYFQKKK